MKQALLVLALTAPAHAADLTITVQDPAGTPLASAVAFLIPQAAAAPRASGGTAVIDQINKQFVPQVLAIPVGTAVKFPNKDNFRHHVYSFSPAKKFEIKLYSGEPAAPVLFDQPGLVTLGCNIHDGMLAYVYVVDAYRFALSNGAGKLTLSGVPPGAYQLGVWHYRGLPAGFADRQNLTLGEHPAPMVVTLTVKDRDPLPPPLDDGSIDEPGAPAPGGPR